MSYNIGDPGPAGGFIFATPQTPGNNTGFYFEAGPHDIAVSQMPPGSYGYVCSTGNTWQPLPDPQNIGPSLPQISGAAEFGWMKAIIPTIVAIPSVSTATGADVGDGKNNTVNLLNPPPNVQAIFYQSAAELCDNYSTVGVDPVSGDGPIDYTDWFLPSDREATLMINNIGPNTQYNQAVKILGPGIISNGITYPHTNKYWTSTADHTGGSIKARIVDSLTGITTNATRCHVYGVRPVRMFLLEEIEREYRCPGAAGGSVCISVPLGSTLPPLNAFQTMQDCNTALQNGDCGGGPDPCVPTEADCYNYRDGIGGVNMQYTPRLTPIYTPGLSGSGAQSNIAPDDNKGNSYRISTDHLNIFNQQVTSSLTAQQWIKKFFNTITASGEEIGENQSWDSVIGLPWFTLNFSKVDAVGNEIDINQFKAQNGSGYLIKIWDKKKRLLGSWLYDNCQVMVETAKYRQEAFQGQNPGAIRNDIDDQCNSFPELCSSKKLRVLFTVNGGKLPQMIDGHHEHNKNYKIIQYGYQSRNTYLSADLNYGSHHTSDIHLSSQGGPLYSIGTPSAPINLTTLGVSNASALGLTDYISTGLWIPSFGHKNEDYALNGAIAGFNPNFLTNSYAYILIKCDYFDNSQHGYAHMNGPNTDEFHMNIICDETHGEWCGSFLNEIPKHNAKCGQSYSWQAAGLGSFPPTLSYATGGKIKRVTNNCRNHGMIGNRALNHLSHGTNTTGPFPYSLNAQLNYPVGCIDQDPTNPCFHQSFSSINFHPWFAQFKPGDGSVAGGNSAFTNVTWYNSVHDFVFDNQATRSNPATMECRHLTWSGINSTDSGTESDPGGRGENGEYVITEFNINEEHISSAGTEKQLTITGDPFSTFSLTITTNDATKKYYNFSTKEFDTTYSKLSFVKINTNGLYQENILFPPSTGNVIYDIRLQAEPHFNTKLEISGLLSHISQTKKLYQYIDKKITFSSSSDLNNSFYTYPTSVQVSKPPSIVTIDDIKTKSVKSGFTTETISWNYTLSNNKTFLIKRQPLITDFESTTTQTVDGATTSSATVILDSVDGLFVGMTVTDGTGLSGTPAIIEVNTTTKAIKLDAVQTFSDGITLTFTGTGSLSTRNINNTEYSLNNLKVVLDNKTTTTTSAVTDSKIIPVASTAGIATKSLQKTVRISITEKSTDRVNIKVTDDISDLCVGQTLVEVTGSDTIIGTPTITSINTTDKIITVSEAQTLTAGNKLTFASSFINSVNVCSDNKPYVERIEGLNLILNTNQNLDSEETIEIIGSSNSATITADIEVSSMGENNIVAVLKLDNILKVI